MTPDYKTDTRHLAVDLAQMIDEKQGTDIQILDVSAPLAIADFFVIATARNNRHAQGIARELDLTLKHRGMLRRNLAGLDGDSGWVLLDFDTVVVHVFAAKAREFYGLENLWADVPRVPFTPAERPEREPEEDAWLSASEDSFPDFGKL